MKIIGTPLVHIEWKDPSHDWNYFYLLETVGNLIHLKGADLPDGSAKHCGDSFWCPVSDAKEICDVEVTK
jgi:hypothetical protein